MSNTPKIRIGDRIKYHFDNYMSSGPASIFLALVVLFFIAFALSSLMRIGIDSFFKSADTLNDLWLTFIQITDPGAIAEDGQSPVLLKVVGVITIFLGLIFFSAVIAFITTQLEQKIDELKKGRSNVIEKEHVVILGWNNMVFEIIRELILANESEKRARIVVMSEFPKEEMDDLINEMIEERKTTNIITRTGKISSLESLKRIAIGSSRSVIILPTCNESATDDEKIISDAKVLKSILAVAAASKDNPGRPHIIAEIFDKNKRDVMTNLDLAKITLVDTEKIVARIIVQTSRTTGLACVYNDLIGFDGSEIYFYKSNWNNTTFKDLPFHFSDGIPIGIKNRSEGLLLNPGPDYTMKEDDEIVIIAEDDSTIKFHPELLFSPADLPLRKKKLKKSIEKELIIGWNSKSLTIIEEYTDYILPGSIIDIIIPASEKKGTTEIARLQKKYPKIKFKVLKANPLRIRDLRKIKPQNYNNVIILNKAEDDTEKIDSTTITTLLMLKDILTQDAAKKNSIIKTQLISEVMNSDNLELVVQTGVNDSIISNKMISKILSQVSENPDILMVYDDLFSEVGSEIYLKPVNLYMKDIPENIAFCDLMALVQKRGEVLIGYRVREQFNDMDRNFGVRVNLPKNEIIHPREGDMLIVLSKNEL